MSGVNKTCDGAPASVFQAGFGLQMNRDSGFIEEGCPEQWNISAKYYCKCAEVLLNFRFLLSSRLRHNGLGHVPVGMEPLLPGLVRIQLYPNETSKTNTHENWDTL